MPWKREWPLPYLQSGANGKFWLMTAFAVAWGLPSVAILSIMYDEVFVTGNYLALIALLFPISWVGIIWYTCVCFARARRFKGAAFELKTYPAALGHYLEGHIHIDARIPEDAVFRVRLTSLHTYHKGNGKNSTYYEDILWQDEQHIPLSAGRQRQSFQVPVLFQLPADRPASGEDDKDGEYVWELDVFSKLKGADYKQLYRVPVFDANVHREITPTYLDFNSPNVRNKLYTYSGDLTKTGVHVQEHDDGIYYYFPAARHKGYGVMAIVTALIFWAIAFGIGISGISWQMTAFVSVFALLFTYYSLRIFLYKTSVNITASDITLRRGMFSGRSQTYQREYITGLSFDTPVPSGANRLYNVYAERQHGKKVELATSLGSRRDVEHLIEQMRRDLRM